MRQASAGAVVTFRIIGVCVLATLPMTPACHAGAGATWHVDDDAPGDPGPGDPLVSDPLEDGSAAHPFDAIQEAIDAASNGDTVLVVDGTYTGPGNRNLDYGGRLITVRGESGDAAACVIDGEDEFNGVIFQNGETAAARLESITIVNTGGHSLPGPFNYGIWTIGASPVIDGCVLRDCFTTGNGAGARVEGGAPNFMDCTFESNTTDGGQGAGLASIGATVTLTGCSFTENVTFGFPDSRGGAVYMNGGSLTVIGGTFRANSIGNGCSARGEAIANEGGTLVIEDSLFTDHYNQSGICGGTSQSEGGAVWGEVTARRCRFIGNRCSNAASGGHSRGGAVYGGGRLEECLFVGNDATFNGHPNTGGDGGAVWGTFEIVNCTFVGNTVGGQVGRGDVVLGGGTVRNSIFWSNGPDTIHGPVSVEASLVGVDPGFVAAFDQGPDDVWGTLDDVGDARLRPGSPAIDAGDNGAVDPATVVDLRGQARFVDDPGTADTGTSGCNPPIVDLGAYEFQGVTPLAEDVDGSGTVTVDDIVAVVLQWGVCPGCPADVDANGVVDIDDLVAVVLAFDCAPGTCGPDCNGNGVPDDQDLSACTSQDCNDDGVPDECQLAGSDCNGNGVLDACDVVGPVVLTSGPMGPIDRDNDVIWAIPAPPAALGDVELRLDAEAGLVESRTLDVSINGITVAADVYIEFGRTCDSPPDIAFLTIDQATYNAIRDTTAGGDAMLVVSAPETVGPCPVSGVTVTLSYVGSAPLDCDGNGVPDSCDIATSGGDCDGNGVLDVCDPGVDCNADGVPDACQLGPNDCNRNGIPDECDVVLPFAAVSPAIAPIIAGPGPSWTLIAPPEAVGDVTLTVTAVAALAASNQTVNVFLNETAFLGVLFGTTGDACPLESVDSLVISAATFNTAVAGGDATIRLGVSGSVSDSCVETFAVVDVSYDMQNVAVDGNGNGIPDGCER